MKKQFNSIIVWEDWFDIFGHWCFYRPCRLKPIMNEWMNEWLYISYKQYNFNEWENEMKMNVKDWLLVAVTKKLICWFYDCFLRFWVWSMIHLKIHSQTFTINGWFLTRYDIEKLKMGEGWGMYNGNVLHWAKRHERNTKNAKAVYCYKPGVIVFDRIKITSTFKFQVCYSNLTKVEYFCRIGPTNVEHLFYRLLWSIFLSVVTHLRVHGARGRWKVSVWSCLAPVGLIWLISLSTFCLVSALYFCLQRFKLSIVILMKWFNR